MPEETAGPAGRWLGWSVELEDAPADAPDGGVLVRIAVTPDGIRLILTGDRDADLQRILEGLGLDPEHSARLLCG